MLELKIQSNHQVQQYGAHLSNYRTATENIHSNLQLAANQVSLASMQRIVIVGSSGSGKSTLARQLGHNLSLPVVHLDKLFWQPGWVKTPHSEWQQTITELAHQEHWIMDGNYRSTLDSRLAHADTIIFLDLPRWLCAIRAMKRRIQYANRARPDMARGCKEYLFDSTLPAFLRWIWDYPNRARPQVIQHISQLEHNKRIVWLRSSREVQQFLQDPTAPQPGITQVGEFYEFFTPTNRRNRR